ncbi:unnamed protein product [Closterium sp. NIES-53]
MGESKSAAAFSALSPNSAFFAADRGVRPGGASSASSASFASFAATSAAAAAAAALSSASFNSASSSSAESAQDSLFGLVESIFPEPCLGFGLFEKCNKHKKDSVSVARI